MNLLTCRQFSVNILICFPHRRTPLHLPFVISFERKLQTTTHAVGVELKNRKIVSSLHRALQRYGMERERARIVKSWMPIFIADSLGYQNAINRVWVSLSLTANRGYYR